MPRPLDPTKRPHRLTTWATWALVTLGTSCAGTDSRQEESADEAWRTEVRGVEPYSPVEKPEEEPIGMFLSELDSSMRMWNRLALTARSPREEKKARMLELHLITEAHGRIDELIEQLETGPPANRVRAAGVLGFTHSVEAQAPLLAALDDPDQDVVHNALLGIAVLQRADTPVGVICDLLRYHSDGELRSNAAHALLSIVTAGGGGDCVVEAARTGLEDSHPFVRSQSALLISSVMDLDSLDALEQMLLDATPLVAGGAARALAHIGRRDEQQKKRVAVSLASSLGRVDRSVRERIRSALIELRGEDLGMDAGPWLQWAHGI